MFFTSVHGLGKQKVGRRRISFLQVPVLSLFHISVVAMPRLLANQGCLTLSSLCWSFLLFVSVVLSAVSAVLGLLCEHMGMLSTRCSRDRLEVGRGFGSFCSSKKRGYISPRQT